MHRSKHPTMLPNPNLNTNSGTLKTSPKLIDIRLHDRGQQHQHKIRSETPDDSMSPVMSVKIQVNKGKMRPKSGKVYGKPGLDHLQVVSNDAELSPSSSSSLSPSSISKISHSNVFKSNLPSVTKGLNIVGKSSPSTTSKVATAAPTKRTNLNDNRQAPKTFSLVVAASSNNDNQSSTSSSRLRKNRQEIVAEKAKTMLDNKAIKQKLFEIPLNGNGNLSTIKRPDSDGSEDLAYDHDTSGEDDGRHPFNVSDGSTLVSTQLKQLFRSTNNNTMLDGNAFSSSVSTHEDRKSTKHLNHAAELQIPPQLVGLLKTSTPTSSPIHSRMEPLALSSTPPVSPRSAGVSSSPRTPKATLPPMKHVAPLELKVEPTLHWSGLPKLPQLHASNNTPEYSKAINRKATASSSGAENGIGDSS